MRIGQNFTPQTFSKSTGSPSGPVQPVQPVQKVDFPLRSNEITIYKPENFNVISYLFPKEVEWNMTVDEPFFVAFKKTVFEMVFKVQEFLSGDKLRLEVTTKNNTKGLRPYIAVAKENSEEVGFYPFNGHSNVELNPHEAFGIKFADRDDLVYAIQFDGMHEKDPSLAEITLHVTNIVK